MSQSNLSFINYRANNSNAGEVSGCSENTFYDVRSRYRVPRVRRACEACRDRKIRCDATSGSPCTRCKAFNMACTIRQTGSRKEKVSARRSETADEHSLRNSANLSPRATTAELQYRLEGNNTSADALFMGHKLTRTPVTTAGRVLHLGESSSMNLLVHSMGDTASSVQKAYPTVQEHSERRKYDELAFEFWPSAYQLEQILPEGLLTMNQPRFSPPLSPSLDPNWMSKMAIQSPHQTSTLLLPHTSWNSATPTHQPGNTEY